MKHGERFVAIERNQGLKKGEKQVVLATLEVEALSQLPLKEITEWDEVVDGEFRFNGDCVLEGFPKLSGQQFIEMFCKSMKCAPETMVYRIQFKYVD